LSRYSGTFFCGTPVTSMSNLSNVSNEPKSNTITFSGFLSTSVSPSSCSTVIVSDPSLCSDAYPSLFEAQAAKNTAITPTSKVLFNFFIYHFLLSIIKSTHKCVDYQFLEYQYPCRKYLLKHIGQSRHKFFRV